MEKLKRQIAEEIKKKLNEENQELHVLFSDVVDDYAYIWDETNKLSKIRKLLIIIVRLFLEEHPRLLDLDEKEKRRFRREFNELVTNPRALLEKSRALQVKRIEGLNPKKWIIKFRADIEDILYIIAKNAKFSPETGKPVKSTIIKVPFYLQGEDECGPTALRMVLKYFGFERSLKNVKQLCSFGDDFGRGGTSSTGIALGAAKIGLKAKCYFEWNIDDESFMRSPYFKKHPDRIQQTRDKILRMKEQAVEHGVIYNEQFMETDEILPKLSKTSIPVVCVDSGKFYGADKPMAHFVVVVGYNADKSSIFINDPARAPYLKISPEMLNAARKSENVDGEVVIISR